MQPGDEPEEVAGGGDSPTGAPMAAAGDQTSRAGRLPDAVTSRANSWVTATPYRLPLAVAAVGLVVSAPFGGWRTAESEVVPTLGPDEVVQAAPFEVTLERAYYSPRPSDTFPELDPGQQYVVVLGTVTSRHEATVDSVLLTGALELEGLPQALDQLGLPIAPGADITPELYSAQDSTRLQRIGPDLTYDVGFLFRTGATQLPEELTLDVAGHTWRSGAFVQEHDWFDPAVVAEVVVPLELKRATDGDSDEGDGR